MSQEWEQGVCNEKTGFLFPHPCQQFPSNPCGECGKPICEEHTRDVEGKRLCPSCAERTARGAACPSARVEAITTTLTSTVTPIIPATAISVRGTSARTLRTLRDPNDLQPGDAESLRDEGTEDFETDMSDS